MCTEEYKQQLKHIANKGNKCPKCGSDLLDSEEPDGVDNLAFQSMRCDNCNATWTDTFVLTGFTDLKPEVPKHFRIMLSRLAGDTEWSVTSNPKWMDTEIACSNILANAPNKYAEYQNCGVAHRMIRAEDAAQYGIDEIKPEWALNPEDIA